MYDVFGDIHGHVDALKILLRRLGYRERQGIWRHPERQALFVGDLIDRGPAQDETIRLVRNMVEAGQAHAIMGNHELNAIGWITPDPDRPGEYLRSRHGRPGDKHAHQHRAFLEEMGSDRWQTSRRHREAVEWFKTLPLWFESAGLRAIHACWNRSVMETLIPHLTAGLQLPKGDLTPFFRKESPACRAIELLLKGPEIPFPKGYAESVGLKRDTTRVAWWDPGHHRFHRAAFELGEEGVKKWPDEEIPTSAQSFYLDQVPVFFGHYWMSGPPARKSPYLACLDYSVANGGTLVAYQWDGETEIDNQRFVAANQIQRAGAFIDSSETEGPRPGR